MKTQRAACRVSLGLNKAQAHGMLQSSDKVSAVKGEHSLLYLGMCSRVVQSDLTAQVCLNWKTG